MHEILNWNRTFSFSVYLTCILCIVCGWLRYGQSCVIQKLLFKYAEERIERAKIIRKIDEHNIQTLSSLRILCAIDVVLFWAMNPTNTAEQKYVFCAKGRFNRFGWPFSE